MPSPTRRVRQPKKRLFLDTFADVGTITHAAKAAGINRQTHYNWLQADPDYAAEFAAAEDQAVDALEREARRRAVDGVDEPVFYRGERVATIRKYSDTLLIFLLKGANPEKYRERITVVNDDVIDAELRRLDREIQTRAAAGEAARAPVEAPPAR